MHLFGARVLGMENTTINLNPLVVAVDDEDGSVLIYRTKTPRSAIRIYPDEIHDIRESLNHLEEIK
jgi:hypothetical protein